MLIEHSVLSSVQLLIYVYEVILKFIYIKYVERLYIFRSFETHIENNIIN